MDPSLIISIIGILIAAAIAWNVLGRRKGDDDQSGPRGDADQD